MTGAGSQERSGDDVAEAIAREARLARARRAAADGAEESGAPLTPQEERDARIRRGRDAAWAFSPSYRYGHDSAGGFVLSLLLQIAAAAGIHLLWPVLVRWMSFRRAAGIVAGAGCGMLCGALVMPRLAFTGSRPTGGDMVGPLLKGEVAAITLAALVLGFGGMLIVLFASQARAAQGAETRGSEEREPPTEHAPRPSADPTTARRLRGAVERALRFADPAVVALSWFLLAVLLTGQFFHAPGSRWRPMWRGRPLRRTSPSPRSRPCCSCCCPSPQPSGSVRWRRRSHPSPLAGGPPTDRLAWALERVALAVRPGAARSLPRRAT